MVPPCFAPTLMSLRTSAYTGVAISIESRGASRRFNGRTRGCLPIDTPAPRPCSADPDPPHHTNRGSLKGFACVLFSSQLLQIYEPIIQSKNPIVNRQITIYRTLFTQGRPLRSPANFATQNWILAPLIYEGGGRAKRGRGEYMLFVLIRTPPCPFGASPLINEGARHLISPLPRTAPPPRPPRRPPASPRSWAKSSPAQTRRQIPDGPQKRRPPTRRRRC